MAKIEKILSLKSQDFSSGVTNAYFSQGQGIWNSAIGLKSYKGNNNTGVLHVSHAGTQEGSGTVDDGIVAHTFDSSAGKLYMMSFNGDFYSYNQLSPGYSNLRSAAPVSGPGEGMEIFRPQGGTKYLYYWRDGDIGRWDTSGTYATGWDDSHFTGLASANHFTHQFGGAIYYTNGSKIGKVYDNAGTAANSTNVLDFESKYGANSLADDGTYLVIGLTSDNVYNVEIFDTKILFWDTFSSSWNKEYSFSEGFLYAIRKLGNYLYAFTDYGVYRFTYDTKPELVFPYSITDAPSDQNETLSWDKSLYWCSGNTDKFIGFYGARYGLPPAYHQPFKLSHVGTYLLPFSADEILVSRNSQTLLLNISTQGSATDLTANSINFDLEGTWKFKRVELIFADELESGDSVAVSLYKESGGTETAWGTASFTTHGATYKVELPVATEFEADTFSFKLTINGSPEIRRIAFYGERTGDF